MPPSLFDLGVIVRTNGRSPQFLRRALGSIIVQTRLPAMIVVVNDSSDGASVKAELGKIDFQGISWQYLPRDVAIQPQPNRSTALNRGLVAAGTRWISFLDDDDTWSPIFLEKMEAVIRREESVAEFGGVVCRTEAIYERFKDGQLSELGCEPFNPHLHQVAAALLAQNNLFTINAVIWRRNVFLKVGGFCEDLSVMEDWEFNVRAALEFRLEILPDYLARYHRRIGAGAAANSPTDEHDRVADKLQEGWRRIGLLAPDQSSGYRLMLGLFLRLRRRRARLGFWLKWGRRG